jgi:hypothetical protein
MTTPGDALRSDRARPSDTARSARRAAGLLIACILVADWPVGPIDERTAHADADEASLHAQAHFGLARVGDPVAGDETDTADFLGIGLRATYARSDWFAYELHATWNQLGRSALYDVPDQPLMIRRLSWAPISTRGQARNDSWRPRPRAPPRIASRTWVRLRIRTSAPSRYPGRGAVHS